MQAFYTRQTAVSHADLAAQVQPSNPVFAAGLPSAMSPATTSGLEALNGEISRQAAMVGLVDVFRLMLVMILALAPLLLVLRKPRAAPPVGEMVVD
jgi:DHA2 family multidrug resistance protein